MMMVLLLAAVRVYVFAGVRTLLSPAMSIMSAVAAVTEHVQADERHEDQHPNPVLRQPNHDYLLAK